MGAAVGLGLVEAGANVWMVDKVSKIHTASKANFGLAWSQGKGSGSRPYARLSEQAVREFTGFAKGLEDRSNLDVELRLVAVLVVSLGAREFAERKAAVDKLHQEAEAYGEKHPSKLVNRGKIQEIVGTAKLGKVVAGGSFSAIDGDVNPLLLLKAMRKVFIKMGGEFVQRCTVNSIVKKGNNYRLETSSGRIETSRVVIAAGLGNIELLSN